MKSLLEFDELRLRLEGLKPDIDDLESAPRPDRRPKGACRTGGKGRRPHFGTTWKTQQSILQRSAVLKGKIEGYAALVDAYHDTLTLIELADEEGDLSLLEECAEGVEKVQASMEEQRLSTLLSGEYDAKNAILTFHAGAGGTEAQDWAEMLYRMYTHWTERHSFKYKILDYLDGDEAGIKSASILVGGTQRLRVSQGGIRRTPSGAGFSF